jgi:hypothetical protein
MNFTILTPNDNPLAENKSDATDTRFGGNREHSKTSKDQDYTRRTGKASNRKENPVDDTIRDIDDMTDPKARKREFSRREETSNVQKSNEASFIKKSDPDKRPRMDEGADAVRVPKASDLKQGQRENRWRYDSSNKYEGEIS